jgi:hypothetical protein
MENIDIGRLKERHLKALEECARHNDRGTCYWFREKSMQGLAVLGLAERWTPPSVAERPRMMRRPWLVTRAGRELLRGFPISR